MRFIVRTFKSMNFFKNISRFGLNFDINFVVEPFMNDNPVYG